MIDGTRILAEARRFESLAVRQGQQIYNGCISADINDSVCIEVVDHPNIGKHVEHQVRLTVADSAADRLKLTVQYNFGPRGTFLERVVNEKGSSMADIMQDTTVDANDGSLWLDMRNGNRSYDRESLAIMQEWNIAH